MWFACSTLWPSKASTLSVYVSILTPGFTPLGIVLYLHENVCVCVFAWQVIRNVEVKCLTYLAISHVINSYMIFFSFIFSYWGVNNAWNVKVAWNWSDARIFNVPLRTYHFLTGKIWGAFPALSLDTNPSITNYDKTILNTSIVSRLINSEVILFFFPMRMFF